MNVMRRVVIYNLVFGAGVIPFVAQAQAFVSTPNLIANIVDFLVGAVFFVSLLAMVFAGYLYLTSAGNAEASSRAKTLILSSIIGILIASLSFLVLNLFSDQFVTFDKNLFSPDPDTLEKSDAGGNDCKCGSAILYNDQGKEEVWCVKEEYCAPEAVSTVPAKTCADAGQTCYEGALDCCNTSEYECSGGRTKKCVKKANPGPTPTCKPNGTRGCNSGEECCSGKCSRFKCVP